LQGLPWDGSEMVVTSAARNLLGLLQSKPGGSQNVPGGPDPQSRLIEDLTELANGGAIDDQPPVAPERPYPGLRIIPL